MEAECRSRLKELESAQEENERDRKQILERESDCRQALAKFDNVSGPRRLRVRESARMFIDFLFCERQRREGTRISL